jgi:hypothetical protein
VKRQYEWRTSNGSRIVFGREDGQQARGRPGGGWMTIALDDGTLVDVCDNRGEFERMRVLLDKHKKSRGSGAD